MGVVYILSQQNFHSHLLVIQDLNDSQTAFFFYESINAASSLFVCVDQCFRDATRDLKCACSVAMRVFSLLFNYLFY